ncbi:MAG: DNA cytosine methyltransferase [Caldilineaceae bacterium]|nr:DNA cytosine methyltransferase [Caldilineaceae bacterium]
MNEAIGHTKTEFERFKNHKTKAPEFLAVDFYCGAGGTTRGLLDAGGYIICGIDNDEMNRITYQNNNQNTTLDEAEPRFLAYDMFPAQPEYPEGQQQEIRAELKELIPKYRSAAAEVPLMFVICAPCQSFTRFIQRRLTDERIKSRNRDLNLLTQTLGFIAEFQPEMIISENVARIKTGQYRHIWSDFEVQLRNLGYSVGEDRVCASRFGVPQYRRRSVMLALKSEKEYKQTIDLPVPSLNPDAPTLSAREAIDHLPALEAGGRCKDTSNHDCLNLYEINRLRLMSVKPGEPNWGFSDTPFGDLSLPCHSRLAAKGNQGFGDSYTRLHPDRPAPTLTTRFNSISNGRFGHYDEGQVRGLSLREGATLQSFEDDYVFHGDSMSAIAKMIGNAVPPRLAAFMATWLLNLWRKQGPSVQN